MSITPVNRFADYNFSRRKFSEPRIGSSSRITSNVLLDNPVKRQSAPWLASTQLRRSYQREQFAYFVPGGVDPEGSLSRDIFDLPVMPTGLTVDVGITIFNAVKCVLPKFPGPDPNTLCKAEAKTGSMYGPDGSAWGGEQDALRHCIWACCLTKKLGAEAAKDILDGHETENPPFRPLPENVPRPYNSPTEFAEDDLAMDEKNNATGVSIGSEGEVGCLSRCQTALRNGELKVNKKGGWNPAGINPQRIRF